MTSEAFVFDMDDTLYLERDYVRSGFAHIGIVLEKQFGVHGAGEFAWSLFESGIRGDTFDRIIDTYELSPEVLPLLVSEYRHHAPDIALEPDAVTVLTDMVNRGVHVGLITDGFGPGQWKKFEALGLDAYIDRASVVVTGDFGAAWTKPSKLPYIRITEELSPWVDRFWYIGDNPTKDFDAPKELGWGTVRVRRRNGLHEHAADKVAETATVSDLSEFEWSGTGARA